MGVIKNGFLNIQKCFHIRERDAIGRSATAPPPGGPDPRPPLSTHGTQHPPDANTLKYTAVYTAIDCGAVSTTPYRLAQLLTLMSTNAMTVTV
ncbi:hypothetical protein WA026_009430 [Henosepilachna vigintioctopunctata]|uniref:Uncharacterized protein n=1 Tax=Henosepilachna vigintioctopunctata TaxID=420089 RepID=A0AAW1U4K9_9CUCU